MPCEQALSTCVAQSRGACADHARSTARCLADEMQLTQLFQNLVGNAIKYQIGGDPQIHISAARMARRNGSSRSRTTDWASTRNTSTASSVCSNGFTNAMSSREPGSGWQSARRSWSSTAAIYRWNRSRAKALHSALAFPHSEGCDDVTTERGIVACIEVLLVEDSPGDVRLTKEVFRDISKRSSACCDGRCRGHGISEA